MGIEFSRRYQVLFEYARDILLVVRASDGRILEANAAAVQAYGYSSAELLTRVIDDLCAPETRGLVRELIQRADADGPPFETLHQRKDRSAFPVEVSVRGLVLDGERVLLGIVRDITTCRQADEARRAAEERFRLVADLAVDYAFALRLTPDGGFELEWDAGRLTSVPNYNFRQARTLETWQAMVHPDDFPVMLAHQRRLLAGETVDFAVRVSAPDGEIRWLQHYGRPRREAGRIVGVLGAVSDITRQRQAETALRASEERYRLISELSSDYAFANRIDPDGTVTREWITDAFTRITGYRPDEVVTPAQWRRLIHPDDWRNAAQAFQNVLEGETSATEFRIKTAEGAERWLRVRSRGAHVPVTGAVRTIGAVQDVTEQKRAEQDLRAHAQRLEILHDLSRSILAARAPAEIASAALNHLDAVVPATGAAVFTWEGQDAPLSLLARRGLLPEALVAGLDPDQPGGIVELAPSGPAGDDHGLRSLLRVPLEADGQIIGALIVVDQALGRFNPGHLVLAEEVMSEVAIALRQRRLQEAENRRRLELEALAEVSAALRQAASSLGVQRVLAEQLMTVVQAEAAALFILEEAWKVAAVAGRAVLAAGGSLAPGLADGLSQRFRGDETSLLWTEASADVAALLTALDPALQAGVLVQLRAADRLPAAVLIGWPGPHAVTSSEGHLLAAIAEIGSNALQRSSLLETLERRVAERTRELSALYEVAAVANQASDLASRLESALALTLRAVGAESGTVYQVTDDGETLILMAHRGLTPDTVAHLARPPVRGTVTGQVLQTGEPVILNDMMARKSSLMEGAGPADRLRYTGLPLRSRGRVLGVLGVVGPGDAHLSAESLALLGTIADQLGTLLEAEGLRRQAERAAVAEERRRLARDLHDSVTQSLYSAVLFATAAQEQVDLGALDRARAFLGRIDAILGQALREMRLLIYELRPAMLEALGLVKALEHRLEAVEAHADIKAQLLVEGDCALPPALEEALYAVAQEALNNALKHSAAQTVTVRLRGAADRVTLAIEDDGRGFDPATAGGRGGAGLGNMRERLARCDGHLQIDSRPGGGTRVAAEVKR